MSIARPLSQFLVLLVTLASIASPSHGEEIVRGFVTDGCTMFPEGTPQNPQLWADCCLEHDLRFWAGGTLAARDRADLRLRDCVAERADQRTAQMMYLGVRMGHLSPVKIPSGQWGNAWARPGFRRLSPEEIRQIEELLPEYSIPSEIERRFVESLGG
jgi:hypothetical protein